MKKSCIDGNPHTLYKIFHFYSVFRNVVQYSVCSKKTITTVQSIIDYHNHMHYYIPYSGNN